MRRRGGTGILVDSANQYNRAHTDCENVTIAAATWLTRQTLPGKQAQT